MKSILCTACVASAIIANSVACGSAPSSSTSAASSSSSGAATTSGRPAPLDYASLLIKAEDIDLPGDSFIGGIPQFAHDPDGVAIAFDNEDHTRTLGDSIVIMPDAAAAKVALDGGVRAFGKSITDPSPRPAPVGSNGVVDSGVSPDGSKAVTIVAFTQGPAFAVMQFDSAVGSPVPEDFLTALAQKQAGVIKNALG
jgi:hypothetical protein